jgi:Putative addiction module component
VESLEFDPNSTLQATWVIEAKRRRDEVHNGTVTPISGEEALAQLGINLRRDSLFSKDLSLQPKKPILQPF